MEQERDFKGIWIPKNIWLSENLSLQEKVLVAEVDSLDRGIGCWANNDYFSRFFGISKTRVSNIINSLQKRGIFEVKIIEKEGNKRYIKVLKESLIGYYRKVGEGIKEKFKHNNIINNTSINKKYIKKKFGEFKNIELGENEIEKLKQDYGENIFNKYIKILDEGIEMKGYKYKNHNLALRNWMNRDGVKKLENKTLDYNKIYE